MLTIFAASAFPAWQDKYIDVVREAFDATHLNVDDKNLNARIAKMGEMKKAMPFVQGLKRRLVAGEAPETVFERKLAFDEVQTLKEMAPGIKKTVGCIRVHIIAVHEGGKSGTEVLIAGEAREGQEGQQHDVQQQLPLIAEVAVPGNPTFYFENVEA